MPSKTKTGVPPSSTKIGDFIESIIGELDDAIQLVDRDLVTGDVIVLFTDGSRFSITVAQSD